MVFLSSVSSSLHALQLTPHNNTIINRECGIDLVGIMYDKHASVQSCERSNDRGSECRLGSSHLELQLSSFVFQILNVWNSNKHGFESDFI